MFIDCIECGETIEVSATEDQIAKWRSGALIQDAMPNVPKAEREMLKTAICPECWDRMFKPQDSLSRFRRFLSRMRSWGYR